MKTRTTSVAQSKKPSRTSPKLVSNKFSRMQAITFGVVIAIAGGVFLLISTRAATTATSYQPTDDTYVSTGDKLGSHATSAYLQLANSAGKCVTAQWCVTTTDTPYLKFNVNGMSAGAVVTQVKLRLYVIDGSDYGGDVYRSQSDSWAGTMPFSAAPGSVGGVLASRTGGVAKNTWIEFVLPVNTITANGTYSFLLRSTSRDSARYASLDSANKPQLVITTQPTDVSAPSAPTTLTASNITSNSVQLNWAPSADNVGVVEYEVLRGGTKIATTTSTSYSDSGLLPGTSYAYAIQAKDGAGNVSATSTPLKVTMLAAATSQSTSGWSLVWSDEFDGTSLNTGNWAIRTGTEGHSQSNYIPANVTVAGGQLQLKTARHCLSSATDSLTATNVSTSACGAGKTTKYSSGYVESKVSWNSGRMEVRAKLPTAAQGLWPAIWLRNTTGWCNTMYGELDLLEWYNDTSGQPSRDQTTATTHISCSNNSTTHVGHVKSTGADLTSAYHTWAVEWSPNAVKYFMDGASVAANSGNTDRSSDTSTDFGTASSLFGAILDDAWKLRLNTQVIKSGDAWHKAPDNGATFNPATYFIDSVKVYQAQ